MDSMRLFLFLSPWVLACAPSFAAETHTLSLAQAIERARAGNPDVLIARLDAAKATQAIRIQEDAFRPKVFAGSGLAYTSGFPMSIEGSAPSVVQARAVASLYDQSQRYRIHEARQNERSAQISIEARQQEAVMRTIELYLDAAHAAASAAPAREQADSAAKLEASTRTRVQEGRQIQLDQRRAALAVAQARQLARTYESNARLLGLTLAEVLGFEAGDEVQTVADALPAPALPSTPGAAMEAAFHHSADLRRLDSQIAAQQLAIRSVKATRLPRVNLIAQYGLLAKFNNYDQFFNAFQRHNGQIGGSIEIPLFMGPGYKAQISQAATEADRLRLEATRLRSHIAGEVRRDYATVEQAELAAEVALLDREVAAESLTVLLARLEEGRASADEVEQARQLEAQKRLAQQEAQHTLRRAQYSLAQRSGTLAP
jgi:outer membrane protein